MTMQNFLNTSGTITLPVPISVNAQADGTPTNPGTKPTKAPLQSRPAAPTNHNTSGMEGALGALADKMHPRKGR